MPKNATRLLACVSLLLLCCGVAQAEAGARGVAADAHRIEQRGHREGPLTLFVAERPDLHLKLLVGPRRIVETVAGSRVHCEGGSTEQGSITSRPWGSFRIGRHGGFEKSSWEAYEGDGDYFTGFRGRVRRNRIVGYYRAWEERTGEEEFFPRCGTVSPRGEEMRFVAHRVEGPPWHRR